MYFLTVGAIFRNESHCIREWLDFYINEGVEHFYLINDNSTDNSVELIQAYIPKYVTLYSTEAITPHVLGHQRCMYNKYILPHVNNKSTQWLLVCDLDEFVWSPSFSKLTILLRDYVPNLMQVQTGTTIYGSNGHISQPPSLLHGFTKRTAQFGSDDGICTKYFVNSNCEYESLNIHHATPVDKKYTDPKYFMLLYPTVLRLNHYRYQSREFWINVKCTRGDADGYATRSIEEFDEVNKIANVVEDTDIINHVAKNHAPVVLE